MPDRLLAAVAATSATKDVPSILTDKAAQPVKGRSLRAVATRTAAAVKVVMVSKTTEGMRFLFRAFVKSNLYALPMKKALLICLILSGSPAVCEVVDPRHLYVIDGDTVDLDGERFRLVGFDTPETYRSQCELEKQLGDMATARLRQLIDSLAVVELVRLPGKDRYERSLGRLYVDQRDVGAVLIGEGLARPYEGGMRMGWCDG